MDDMKESGIPWLGEIPAEWKIKRLKYIADYMGKGNGITKAEVILNGDTPCIRYGEIYSKYDHSFNKCITRTNIDKITSPQYFSYGDILFAGTGELVDEIGKNIVYLGHEECLAGGDIIIMKHSQQPSYLSYALNSSYAQTQKSMGKAKLKVVHISSRDLGNLRILLPPVEEQQRIADFLDEKCGEIDGIVEKIKQEMETLKKYKKSLVFDTLIHGLSNHNFKKTDSGVWTEIPMHWKLIDIKYIFEIVKRIAGREGYDILSVTQKGLRVKDISGNEGQIASDYSNYQFVYPTDYVMNHMDLLTGWVDCSSVFGVTSPDYRVFRLRNKKMHNLDYFKYVMQCCYMCRIFYSLGRGVSTLGRWRLQTEVFMNFKIPVPPLEEQREIAAYLDQKCAAIDGIISSKEEQLQTLASYKKSLIYEYVTGKKRVPTA